MTQLREVYKCEICGNMTEVVQDGGGELVCCGQPMTKLVAKFGVEGKEKHVPVMTDTGAGVKVNVGSVDHPMEAKHYIKFIEVLTADKVLRAELKPAQAPSAVFQVKMSEIQAVREYCTVHGLWKDK